MKNRILKGNIAPNGISIRMEGLPEDMWVLRGQVWLFKNFEEAAEALDSRILQKGSVLFIPSSCEADLAARYNESFVRSGLSELMCTLTRPASAGKITAGGVLSYREQDEDSYIKLLQQGDVFCYDVDAGAIYLDIGEDGFESRLSGNNTPIITTCLGNGTWALLTRFSRMYLLEGRDKALLIDTGFPVPGFLETLRGLTDKPIELALTHGHFDHCGNSNLFDHLSIHEKDMPLFLSSMPETGCRGKIHHLTDGQIFDLGGRKIKAIYTPGHTHGSSVFYDAAAGTLFSGDAIGMDPIISFLEQGSLSELYESYKRIRKECPNLKTVFSGHGTLLLDDSNRLLDDLTICANNILQGKAVGLGTCVTRNQQMCKTYKFGIGTIYN